MLVLTRKVGEKVIIGNNLATIERLPNNRFSVNTPDVITIIGGGEIGEKFKVVDDVFVTVLAGDWRIGIEAPREIDILREEVWNRKVKFEKEALVALSEVDPRSNTGWINDFCQKLLGGAYAKNI